MKIPVSSLLFVLFLAVSDYATIYNVGPGQTLANIAAVPWASLQPGDTVQIHWRAEGYAEKWVIGRSGTAAMPITVRGIAGPNGELPVIDGRNATTPAGLNFWSENRGVIKIGGSNVPASTFANYIVIENLEIRSGHPSYNFTNDSGGTEPYSTSASSIYVERGETSPFAIVASTTVRTVSLSHPVTMQSRETFWSRKITFSAMASWGAYSSTTTTRLLTTLCFNTIDSVRHGPERRV